MQIKVTTPLLPESVQDARLLEWRRQPGEAVTRGETLVEMETDKVVLDVPAPIDGVLLRILHAEGDIVTGGIPLALIETETAEPDSRKSEPQNGTEPGEAEESFPIYNQPVSPSVRRLLTEHHLDATQIRGTGKDGRLTKQDILDCLEIQQAKPAIETVAMPPPSSPSPREERGERRVPMTRLRARIAERMIQSQHNTATLTTFNEVNLQKVFELRNLYKARFEQEHNIKLGFMSFFVKAAVEALKRFPIVNAGIDGDDIVYHDYYDIGIAVSTDRGLVVPVLRDADKLDFGSIEKAVLEFSRKARDGKLSFEDLSGGTFSITNGGIYGSMLSTPILNPPQSGILGMHAIKERPVVENGQIVIRPMIYLAFSYDHRLIDGRDAVLFLYAIKELLEDPVRMVLNV
ncbi:MAG: 2-oxoglutarate dehydrogenase complex dihydrolipoyllysine-residue succinyltransferase [Methylococcaceae bacterium]|nr:2-oxoglutarate dehydrogenase complex dihydrolipoyllysine-residue succinyltransferase [Methylococcaceae bacterium]